MSIEKNIEYASIGLSAIGAAVALATQQLIYLATPLTVSLAISLSNRQREIARCNTRIANLEQSYFDNTKATSLEIQAIKNMDLGQISMYSLIEGTKLNPDSVVADSSHLPNIYDRIDDLNASLLHLHDLNIKLDHKVTNTVILDRNTDKTIQQKVDKSIQDQFEIIKQIFPRKNSYSLVHGRDGSRKIFIDALRQSEKSLFLVCPWVTKYAIDLEVERLIESALQRNVCINIGWGHLKDGQFKTEVQRCYTGTEKNTS